MIKSVTKLYVIIGLKHFDYGKYLMSLHRSIKFQGVKNAPHIIIQLILHEPQSPTKLKN